MTMPTINEVLDLALPPVIRQRGVRRKSTEDILHDQMEPIADQLYHEIWGPLRELHRLSHNRTGEVHPLDKEWAIDVILKTTCGLPITLQDKFREYKYHKLYDEFTLEYENNPETHEEGEFYHLVANYYFYGFATPDKQSFISWKVIDLNTFKEFYRTGRIKEDGVGKNRDKGKATFLYFAWKKLRDNGLLLMDFDPELFFGIDDELKIDSAKLRTPKSKKQLEIAWK